MLRRNKAIHLSAALCLALLVSGIAGAPHASQQLAMAAVQTGLPTPAPSLGLQAFLLQRLGFTAAEVAAVDRGEIVVRLPRTAETREVAAFAIMRLDVSSAFFLERVRDIVNFKKSENVLQIGKFSDPPKLDDLASLTLSKTEIEAMRRCRVNQCEFKMSAQQIERFRKEVNWSAANYGDAVTHLTRQVLLERVQAYLKRGNAALGEYNDKTYELHLSNELQSLIEPSPYMYGYQPEFQQYLKDFPNSRTDNVESFFYWSKEEFGLKPVISVTHISIHRFSGARDTSVLIASKGIYANHYFEASLGFTGFIQTSGSQPRRTYLIYINRSKTDALRGLFAGIKRSLINGRLKEAAKTNMEFIKSKLEGEYVQ